MGRKHEFDRRMEHLYWRTGRSMGYWASRFLATVRRNGGLEAARLLLKPNSKASDGFRNLIDAGRIDLSVEFLATRAEFRGLFTN